MLRATAQKFCDRVNKLDCVFVADIEDAPTGRPRPACGLRIRHVNGNEVGFTRDVDEGEYLTRQIESSFATCPPVAVPAGQYEPEAGFIL